jgi:hypothetical protein
MKHAQTWAGIIAVIGAIVAFIFGRRSNLHDNGSGVDSIGNGIDDGANRAESITSGNSDAEKRLDNIAGRIDNAAIGIEEAIGIVQDIRKRGSK